MINGNIMTDYTSLLQHNVSLKDKNTLRLNSEAKDFFVLSSEDDCKTLHYIYKEAIRSGEKKKFFALGEGSNTIFADRNIQSLVVKIENKGFCIRREDDDSVFIECAAGELFREFVLRCCENGYSGLENLAAIYGTVGASPVQNIGAYGQEVKNFVYEVKVFDIQAGQFAVYSNEDCHFAYRNSVFKYQDGYKIILSVTFKLNKHFYFNDSYKAVADCFKNVPEQDITPLLVAHKVTEIRNGKLPDPKYLPNVGSFFKNPVISSEHYGRLLQSYPNVAAFDDLQGKKISAGWLIEQCGFKGKRIKNTGMHDKQALILVNYADEDAEGLLDYARTVIDAVKTKFDIDLVPEPHIVK